MQVPPNENNKFWYNNRHKFRLLYQVWLSVNGKVMSAGAIEKDFTAAGRTLGPLRSLLDPRFFQAQLLAHLNRGLLVIDEMPAEDMTIKEVHEKLPKQGFVPKDEDEQLPDLSDDDSGPTGQGEEIMVLD